jgi:hypothetical protein
MEMAFHGVVTFVKPEDPEPDSWGKNVGDDGSEEEHVSDEDMLNVSSFGKYIYFFYLLGRELLINIVLLTDIQDTPILHTTTPRGRAKAVHDTTSTPIVSLAGRSRLEQNQVSKIQKNLFSFFNGFFFMGFFNVFFMVFF